MIASPSPTTRSSARARCGGSPERSITRSRITRIPGVWPVVDQNSAK